MSSWYDSVIIKICPIFSLLFALSVPLQAEILFVSPTGSGSDGLSWTTAFPTIGEALISSSAADEIWVKSATYTENLTIATSLTLLGGFAGSESLSERELRDPRQLPTIIDGNSSGRGVTISSDIHLDGFTIQNGLSSFGSGIHLSDATATLSRIAFIDNGQTSSRSGGGLYARNSRVHLSDCLFRDNQALSGGGVFLTGCILRFKESHIVSNRSGTGGGLYLEDCQAFLENSEISENRSSFGDGGGCFIDSSKVAFASCRFHRNSLFKTIPGGGIPNPFDVVYGGAIRCVNADNIRIVNTIFDRNFGSGGAIVSGTVLSAESSGPIDFVNCSIVVSEDWSSFGLTGNASSFVNTIIVGRNQNRVLATLPVSYSLIMGGHPGEGNIDADPMFVDLENGDLHLQRGSPCIDSGTDTGLTVDFDGNQRPLGIYDMGAFELDTSIRGDIDGNGMVNVLDLLILQQDWGKVSGP